MKNGAINDKLIKIKLEIPELLDSLVFIVGPNIWCGALLIILLVPFLSPPKDGGGIQ